MAIVRRNYSARSVARPGARTFVRGYTPSPMVARLGRVARGVGMLARRAGPAAMVAGAVYDAVQAISSNASTQTNRKAPVKSTSTSTRGVAKVGKYRTKGRYAGRFRRTRRNKKDMFRHLGFMHTTEVHGTVTDPDCVYIGHSAHSQIQLLEVICQSLLKKLFAKAGWQCRNITEPIPGYEPNTSNCWKLVLYRENKETGAVDSSITYTTPSATQTSIYQIVGNQAAGVAALWGGFRAVLEAYATGEYATGTGSSLNVQQPTKLRLFRAEDNVGSFWQFQSEINLENEWIVVKGNSKLKVQNRSVAADASTDANDVSNNPIEGRIYSFSSGSPRSKIPGAYFVEGMFETHGVIAARAGQMTSVEGFKEPPPPTSWWNCKGSAKVRIEPGDIKTSMVSHYRSMPFLLFLKRAGFGYGTGSPKKQINFFGKSAMIALEDMINVNPSHNLSIAYECNREFGCYFVTKNRNISIGYRYDIIYDNDAPP